MGPWEPPSSLLNHLLGSPPQTEGQVNIPGMREEEISPSTPPWGPGTVSRSASPTPVPRTASQLLVPLLPAERSLPVVPAFKGRLSPECPQLVWGEALELGHQRREQFCSLGIRGRGSVRNQATWGGRRGHQGHLSHSPAFAQDCRESGKGISIIFCPRCPETQ